MPDPTDRDREMAPQDWIAVWHGVKRLAMAAVNSQSPGDHPWLTLDRAEEIQGVAALGAAFEEGRADERERCAKIEARLADEQMDHNLLKELLSRPEIDDFWQGIILEAAHQRQRWGDAHDREKSAENWFWLIGYLTGKALRAAIEGDKSKAKHHTISAAAALFQWHKAICADETNRGIGLDPDLEAIAARIREGKP